MGKIRIKTLGVEELEEKQKKQLKQRKEEKKIAKTAKAGERTRLLASERSDGGQVAEVVPTAEELEKIEVQKEIAKQIKEPEKKAKKTKKARKRSSRYQAAKSMVEPKKYALSEALELLEKLNKSKFDETVELHINTTETGISGNLTLPHGTGKKVRVEIADEKIIAEVEKGKINFDILVATPEMMPKLAKVAKVLGPRGLMPNPKNGTITQKPEEVVKKYEGGQISFKTESKTPIIHLTIGKISFGNKKLLENVKVALSAIQASKIRNITLKSTMSPAIKIQLD